MFYLVTIWINKCRSAMNFSFLPNNKMKQGKMQPLCTSSSCSRIATARLQNYSLSVRKCCRLAHCHCVISQSARGYQDTDCLTYLLTHSLTHSLTHLLTHSLTPISRVLLEKLTGFQQVKNSPHFMEHEGSLPHSQVSATCPYPEPARCGP